MASQTQPEVSKLITDIFGDSDDEDDIIPAQQATPLPVRSNNDDDLFESDDEDEHTRKPQVKRLQKSAFVLQKNAPTKKRKENHEEKKKLKVPKEKRRRVEALKETPQKSEPRLVDSSDEYDSDSDIDNQRTAEDDAFLDQDDDDAELMAEYNADNQHFHDERPDKPLKRPGASAAAGPKSDNPLDQTLHAMKKTKFTDISDTKKAEIAQSLLFEMDKAEKEDQLLFERQEPAVRKLQLLPTCQRVINMKTMHNTLLDFDLLGVLRAWIEPRDKNTLSSLPIRTAVYNMLMKLPCQIDHLKRSSIGKTIMALIHHKHETPANKLLLRELVEKWSRPIFNKSADLRAGVAAMQSAPVTVGPTTPRNNKATSIEDVLSANSERKKGSVDQSRVRLPTSNGFRFTVQPASATVPKRKSLEEELGASKGQIMKRMKAMKGNSGKKDFRAMKADLSGRDKA